MIPKNISLKRTVALVMCLAKLHNFCINERESIISPMIANDEANIELEGAVPLQSYNLNTPEGQHTSQQPLPMQLLGAGNHFNDMSRRVCRARDQDLRCQMDEMLPCERMLLSVSGKQLQRPTAVS